VACASEEQRETQGQAQAQTQEQAQVDIETQETIVRLREERKQARKRRKVERATNLDSGQIPSLRAENRHSQAPRKARSPVVRHILSSIHCADDSIT
jgi:hypothetical protein